MFKLIKFEIFKLLKKKNVIIIFIFISMMSIINIYLSNINYQPKNDSYKYIELTYDNSNKDVKEYNKYIKDNIKKYNYYKKYNIKTNDREKAILETSLTFLAFMSIIISIISSGILLDEINYKTLKGVLLKPYSRIQIISSKFIIMLIISLSIALIISISSIISSSFILDINWLSVKRLYFINDKIIKSFYLIEYFKSIIINTIPIIFISGFCIFLSTFLNNSKVISSISILFSLMGVLIFQLFLKIDFNLIQYTFIPYLDIGLYKDFKNVFNINYTYGISTSLLSGILILVANYIIFYIFSIIIFRRKDV